jgi:hypothetical protein
MPKPTDYKHIAAWGQMMGSYQYYITGEQEKAAAANAPLDAIYFRKPEEADDAQRVGIPEHSGWHRFSEVTNPQTLWYFKMHYPELAKGDGNETK